MGMGVSALILIEYPFEARWLKCIGIVYWSVAALLMIFLSVLFILRHIIYKDTLIKIWKNPLQAPLCGYIPMALGSIIVCITSIFGERAIWISYVLWWVDVILSVYCTWIILFVEFAFHDRTEPNQLNAVILLPIVAMVVNSTTGAAIVKDLPLNWQPHVMVISLLEWGNGELLAFATTCIYLWRLYTSNLPTSHAMITCFIPIGPLGQGAYGIILNGQNIQNYFARVYSTDASEYESYSYLCIGIALVLVGFASFWIFCAVSGCIFFPPRKFGIGWWALTFPLGTYGLATTELGRLLNTESFKVVGAIVGTTVTLIALILFFTTLYYTFLTDNIVEALKNEATIVLKQSGEKCATSEAAALDV
ncbi:voltage-dependent anion channel [Dipodascopsis uninucleata]